MIPIFAYLRPSFHLLMRTFLRMDWRAWLGPLALLVLTFLLVRPVFRDYLTRPNTMMHAFGGDALMLYYNTAFHTRHGDGSTLRNMNYPDGEYIFLTDAQGAVSNTAQWISRHVTDVSGYAVGIVNGLNVYLLFVAALLVFWVLRALGVHLYSALLFSPLIVMLAPQLRRLGGHFGLAYPFLIPLAMLWFLRKYRVGRLEKRDALMLAVSLFFTFNNPYTGFNVNFFLILAGLLVFAFDGFKLANWRRPAIIMGMGAVSLGLVFLDFRVFDSVKDRLNPQWGFFHYQATFEGLFHPPKSFLYDLLSKNKVAIPEIEFEALLNVGIVTTLALAIMLLMSTLGRFWGKNRPTWHQISPEHRILLLAAGLLFVLASNTDLIPISEDWLEGNMGWLLMFKASGRLGWAFYFALVLTGVVFVDRLYRITSPWFMAAAFPLGLAVLWQAEINQYVKPHFENNFHENFFSEKNEREITDAIRANNVDISQFQAVLCLPKMMAWNDKIHSDISFATQFYGVRFSLATGLPMVNAMLSRIGMQHTLERVEMLSHPLVDRALPKRFPNQKDILLLHGDEAPPLKEGEQYLISISTLLYKAKGYALYRLRLADLMSENPAQRAAKAAFQQGNYPAPIVHFGYEDTPYDIAFYGRGSHQTQPESEQILEYISPFDRDTSMVFSAWTYLDARHWGSGYWDIVTTDSNGNRLAQDAVDTSKSNDVQGSWVRSSARIALPKGAKVTILAKHKKAQLIDEVMLWPGGSSPITALPGEETFLCEGFKVRAR